MKGNESARVFSWNEEDSRKEGYTLTAISAAAEAPIISQHLSVVCWRVMNCFILESKAATVISLIENLIFLWKKKQKN